MKHVEHARPRFPADAFAGTSAYYVRYRIPYPERLLNDLIRRSAVTGKGRLLDLACGPGRVALDLASSFHEVRAIDLEPKMIEAGRHEAERRRIRNILWQTGRAEDFEPPPGSFSLITIGDAFHRLDQRLVAERALHCLEAGCCVAILGSHSIFSEREAWQRISVDVVRRWTKRPSKDAAGSDPRGSAEGPDLHERVMREAGFIDVASHVFVEPQEWTIDSILGFLYSTSVSSKAVLGGSAQQFEAELTAAMLAHDPAGTYQENIQWGYTLARKPG